MGLVRCRMNAASGCGRCICAYVPRIILYMYTRGMLSIFGERERPNLSAGCMSDDVKETLRQRLGTSTYLRAYTVDPQLQMKAYPGLRTIERNFRANLLCAALAARAKLRLYVETTHGMALSVRLQPEQTLRLSTVETTHGNAAWHCTVGACTIIL